MSLTRSSLLLALALISMPAPIAAFLSTRPYDATTSSFVAQHNSYGHITRPNSPSSMMMMMARYGPRDDDPQTTTSTTSNTEMNNKLKSEFTSLLHTIINATTPEEEYPSLFTQNIEMILNVIGSTSTNEEGESLLEVIVQEDVQSHSNDDNDSSSKRLDQISEAVNLILSFVETFVEQTKSIDNDYKQLLGKIFTSIAPNGGASALNDEGPSQKPAASAAGASAMENQLDNLLSSEQEAFTPGFLRHVEGECGRIASLKVISPESAKMLQILRLIQTRVLEELGKGIGEGAIVLGQLLGYDEESERLAVLDAGLAVRGLEFANELAALTEEALEGFKAVPEGNVDPMLVKSVEVIDERIRVFIGRQESEGVSSRMDFQ